MKIYPYSIPSRIASSLVKLARKISMEIVYRPNTINLYLIVGDGSPDVEIMASLLHVLNHSNVVAVVKPENVGEDAIADSLKVLASKTKASSIRVLAIIDQDDKGAQERLRSILEKVTSRGFTRRGTIKSSNRYEISIFEYGGRSIYLGVVVNGVDEVPVEIHEIEDYLLHLTQRLHSVTLPPNHVRSKELWRYIENRYGVKYYDVLAKVVKENPQLLLETLSHHKEAVITLKGL